MRGLIAFVWQPTPDRLFWSAAIQQRFAPVVPPATLGDWIGRAGPGGTALRHAVRQAHQQGHAEFAAPVGSRRLRFDATSVVGPGGEREVVAMALDLAHPTQDVLSQTVQVQRLASLGRLASGITHDFNNALTAIIGFAEMALMDAEGPLAEDLGSIRSAAARAAALSRQLLDFSRPTDPEPTEVHPNQVVDSVREMLARLLPPTVQLDTALSPDDASVVLEPGTLEQVVLNLVINARDAMPGGGRIRIETDSWRLSDSAHLGVEPIPPGDYVRITVADQGSGITPDVLGNVFEPFYTTKQDGTGLGLSTVFGIVKRYGGYVGVRTEVGQGSTFTVVLPELPLPR